jgi:AcrR family transcriptional regulator
MSEVGKSKRTYSSPARVAAARATRERVLEAACRLLGQVENVNAFTLEAVANAAGVTRLTVYNQFGSRRALMEAVFDQVAAGARLESLGTLAIEDEPAKALEAIVQSFCRFWSEPAVMRLQDAVGSDPEFDHALSARHERRRGLLKPLAKRFAPKSSARLRAEVVDTLFALTSPQMYRLISRGRSATAACRLVVLTAWETLCRLERQG